MKSPVVIDGAFFYLYVMKKILFVILFFPSIAFAQNFGTDTTVKYVQKIVTAITPAHEYFQLYNFLGDSLPMRWRAVDSLTFYPSNWTIALQDNITYHNPIIDSSDFILPDTVGAMDKIIINVTPNGTTGYGEIVIELINLDSTAEKIRVTFQINIIPAPNGIDKNLNEKTIKLFPNPTQEFLSVTSQCPIIGYEIIDLTGRIIKTQNIQSELAIKIEVSDLKNAPYFLKILTDKKSEINYFLKQ